MYLAICFAAAAFQANSSTRGVLLGDDERYVGDVYKKMLWPIFWKSDSGFATSDSGGVIEGSIAVDRVPRLLSFCTYTSRVDKENRWTRAKVR